MQIRSLSDQKELIELTQSNGVSESERSFSDFMVSFLEKRQDEEQSSRDKKVDECHRPEKKWMNFEDIPNLGLFLFFFRIPFYQEAVVSL